MPNDQYTSRQALGQMHGRVTRVGQRLTASIFSCSTALASASSVAGGRFAERRPTGSATPTSGRRPRSWMGCAVGRQVALVRHPEAAVLRAASPASAPRRCRRWARRPAPRACCPGARPRRLRPRWPCRSRRAATIGIVTAPSPARRHRDGLVWSASGARRDRAALHEESARPRRRRRARRRPCRAGR